MFPESAPLTVSVAPRRGAPGFYLFILKGKKQNEAKEKANMTIQGATT